jgi:hypothetical protein
MIRNHVKAVGTDAHHAHLSCKNTGGLNSVGATADGSRDCSEMDSDVHQGAVNTMTTQSNNKEDLHHG